MKSGVIGCVLVLCLLPAEVARAEPFSLHTAFSTQGTFTCLRGLACSGSGTNSVVLGSGSNTATLTFNGVNTTFEATNVAQPVLLGQFTSTGSEGFTFPTRTNPNIPILLFSFQMIHTAPESDTMGRGWYFGPGGESDLPFMMGTPYLALNLGIPRPPGANYSQIVYSISPVLPDINGSGTTNLVANAGVVPEPATMLLVGGGIAGLFARRRKSSGEAA
jgi:hypothetical protein